MIKRLLIFLILANCLSGCYEKMDMNTTSFSIKNDLSAGEEINYETIYGSVQKIINEKLPDAEYAATYYQCSCQKCILNEGKLTFLFKEDYEYLLGFKKIYLFAWVVVNLQNGEFDLNITDVTDNYPNLEKYSEVNNQEFYKVLSTAEIYLAEKDISDCKLEISQQSEYWQILVGSINNTGYFDEFGITSDGKIIQLSNPITRD